MKALLLSLIIILCLPTLKGQNNSYNYINQQVPAKIGDVFDVDISTAHPYRSTSAELVFEREFHSKNSGYIKLYFEDFNLAPGDYVEIYSPKTNEKIIYAGKGKRVENNYRTISNFWSQIIFSDQVIVKLHTVKDSEGFGFNITKVAYGYSLEKIEKISQTTKALAICGEDDREPIICYKGTEMYTKSMAVCKLYIGPEQFCTGWLLGCDGTVVTNNHCLSTQELADNTDLAFNYIVDDCDSGDVTIPDRYGDLKVIKTNEDLDVTLLKASKKIIEKYGYLSLSSKAPKLNDRIYLPQHPMGRPKEIAVKDDFGTGFAKVDSISPTGIRYYCDTEVGTSGSPVLDYNTHLVVGLHNSGACRKVGNGSEARSDVLIEYIGEDMPECGVDDPNLSANSFGLPIGLKIYPNPTNHFLQVTGLNRLQSNNSLKIINLQGQTVVTTLTTDKPNETIDVSKLPNGVYFLNINDVFVIRFVVKE